MDSTIGDAVLNSIDKRWKKVDQDVFILAVFLNPYVRTSCFAPESSYSSFNGIWALVVRVYRRVFNTASNEEPGYEFSNAARDYFSWLGEFSESGMRLQDHRRQAENEVILS